jgi:hypothetical protein
MYFTANGAPFSQRGCENYTLGASQQSLCE